MIVCNCFNIRERDIASMASDGPCCLRSVRQATGLGTNCGKCIPHARAVLKATNPGGSTLSVMPMVSMGDLRIATT